MCISLYSNCTSSGTVGILCRSGEDAHVPVFVAALEHAVGVERKDPPDDWADSFALAPLPDQQADDHPSLLPSRRSPRLSPAMSRTHVRIGAV
jgi:hypothetical protein